jgi:hypothetical protein
MALDREPIYSALLTALTSVGGWGTPPSRRLRPQSGMGLAEQPAAYLVGGVQEVINPQRGVPDTWRIRAVIVLYVRTDNPDVAPGSILDPLITAIERALEQQSGGDGFPAPNAPGNLRVANVLRAGIIKVELSEGIDSGQGAAVLDVEIVATST